MQVQVFKLLTEQLFLQYENHMLQNTEVVIQG